MKYCFIQKCLKRNSLDLEVTNCLEIYVDGKHHHLIMPSECPVSTLHSTHGNEFVIVKDVL